jgi:hypothetical protein
MRGLADRTLEEAKKKSTIDLASQLHVSRMRSAVEAETSCGRFGWYQIKRRPRYFLRGPPRCDTSGCAVRFLLPRPRPSHMVARRGTPVYISNSASGTTGRWWIPRSTTGENRHLLQLTRSSHSQRAERFQYCVSGWRDDMTLPGIQARTELYSA